MESHISRRVSPAAQIGAQSGYSFALSASAASHA